MQNPYGAKFSGFLSDYGGGDYPNFYPNAEILGIFRCFCVSLESSEIDLSKSASKHEVLESQGLTHITSMAGHDFELPKSSILS